MPTLKIPGVYVQEVPTLPPGVAEVNSAVPAFIGYTLTTKFNDQDLKYQPIKVQSMLEYVRFFGESSPFTIEGVTADLTQTANEATVSNHFYLYDSLQLYFLNGGGPCYIVSIGTYAESSDSDEPYIKGLDTLDLHDEPTLYLFPDAVLLPDDSLAKVQQVSLRKCGELMDRFSILDVKRNTSKTSTLEAVANFRNKIGMGNLNYGAAYTPWLSTTLGKTITVASINNIFTTLNSLPVSLLNTEINGSKISASISDYKKLFDNLNTLAANPTIKDIAATYSDAIEAYVSGAKKTKNPFDAAELFKPVLEFTITSGSLQIFWDDNVKSQINTWKEELVEKTKDGTDEEKASAKENYLLGVLNSTNFERFTDLNRYVRNGLQKIVTTYETFLIDNIPFYASLLKVLNNKLTELPPSGAMAGLYCKIDSERGVWKAPANISVSAINGVSQLYTNADLADLNVDPVAGKSINVIRPITGYGNMVMGARTLAGNDSEWRYVPVRRLFIFIEENLKKATAWAIFEPNDRLLWLKVRTQIENYLFELWRQGALAGAKPEHAYQVNCGLNSTMTPQDVLEGKLIVEIKLAAVRPAEFILLKFSHQLQKS
jgi:phage tail sheath protein FI